MAERPNYEGILNGTGCVCSLIHQLTAPVRWTQSVQNMVADGATDFIECGPGKVLQGLVKKIAPEVATEGV